MIFLARGFPQLPAPILSYGNRLEPLATYASGSLSCMTSIMNA
ncbi:hypothetical protein G1C95_2116 [Bifidobacterium sp. DSM 109957]|uniref:Uncharacterized protein n=1 Tax=Bifidobacterium oedipodis TaxID=2675322 RepID=A0A7Y0ER60_9BIFI|nr:hypothetical protein [Bifidobacterium sp. DSM 109957]